jgi:hypothetical protein
MSYIDTCWVSQHERIFVYPSHYLGQYHPKLYWYARVLPSHQGLCMVYKPKWCFLFPLKYMQHIYIKEMVK